jgi:hypothetical protein
MSNAYAIEINAKDFEVFKGRVKNPQPGNMRAAGAIRRVCVLHYQAKSTSGPSKLSGKGVNFWADVGRSIIGPSAVIGGASIAITHPAIFQKIYGGPITAKNGKWLTIPASASAYGKSARSLPLRFIPLRSDTALLALKDNTIKQHWKAKRHGGNVSEASAASHIKKNQVVFWLKKTVTQKPTPWAVPPRELLEAAAAKEWSDWIKNQI